ncbi:MAG: nucleoside hydrolase [Gammaproteobacteria bacterium]|nr:nucleoside hydrolase [Gammaproteobacteria bacterium]
MKRYILLDSDPGHDDAIAIMCAGANKDFDLIGLTVVSGNQTLEKTARNAYNITKYFNIDIPIALGASDPIKRKRLNCPEIHGESGLDGFDFPVYDYKYDKRDASLFIKEKLEEYRSVTIVTTGPMTNIANTLIKYPEVKKYISEIVSMGGAFYSPGNTTKEAEFNIIADPDAVKIVLESGIKISFLGLDVTRKVLVEEKIIEKMAKLNTRGSDLFVKLMKFFNKSQKKVFNIDAGPLHDPVTLVSLLSGDVVKFNDELIDVVLNEGDTYGKTIVSGGKYKAKVAKSINVSKYWDVIEEVLNYYK